MLIKFYNLLYTYTIKLIKTIVNTNILSRWILHSNKIRLFRHFVPGNDRRGKVIAKRSLLGHPLTMTKSGNASSFQRKRDSLQ